MNLYWILIKLKSTDKKMYRGCKSDATKERQLCDAEDNGTCVKCSDDGCNDHPMYGTPTLSCINCHDANECGFGQNVSTAAACKEAVLFGAKESCFVHSHEGMNTYRVLLSLEQFY